MSSPLPVFFRRFYVNKLILRDALRERYSDAAPESVLGQSAVGSSAGDDIVTPASLTQLLLRMREAWLADLAHPASAQPMAMNKRLERTQAVG